MLAGPDQIERPGAEVTALEAGQARLSDGSALDIDIVLWGTGYRTDSQAVTSVNELTRRRGGIVRSLDEPDLYFPDVGLKGYGATSCNSAIMARSVMSHIRDAAQPGLEPLPHRLYHLEMVSSFARRGPASFGRADADEWCREVGLSTPDDRPYPLPAG